MRKIFTPKFYLAAIILCMVQFHCVKKAIENTTESQIVSAMVDGRWMLFHYEESGTVATGRFSHYEFQFHENGRLDAISSSETVQGSWEGNIAELTITTGFPASASPLNQLSVKWTITDADNDNVYASNTSEAKKIQLRRK